MYRETNLYSHNRTRTATTGTSMRHTWSEISDICCGCRSRTQLYQCARTEQWMSLRVARRNLRDANECGRCACMRECILTLAQLPTEPKEKSVSSTVRLCPRVRNCGSVCSASVHCYMKTNSTKGFHGRPETERLQIRKIRKDPL